MVRIGIDTGGTFTDFVCYDGGRLVVYKVRSTPEDPSQAILQGLATLTDHPADADLVHGSTVATNALLERRGARVALLVTEGFEDLLRIGRQTRRELYNVFVEAARPVVDPARTFGVRERVAADGQVILHLKQASIRKLIEQVRASSAEIVAVCLLHAYRTADHEQRLQSLFSRAGFPVSASHAVLPEYREFERCSTTVVNAYVSPLMNRYLARLEARLAGSSLSIMQSNGGTFSTAQARATPVHTILSGPAAGAVGAHALARAAGFPRVIGFDMGGTSTDVTLIDRALRTTTESQVGDCPVRIPMIDIQTVGAGGGSIAHLDSGSALRVGPRSAGAVPGPVCCGAGSELTVTDAHLLLGRLDPHLFFGGRLTLDVRRTRAVAAKLSRRLGLTPHRLAEGVIRIANSNMQRALRVVSVQRGHDPRRFALLAFGGAGGMHACDLADSLDIPVVLAPRYAGVLSALGMLLANVTRDYLASWLRPVDDRTSTAIRRRFQPLLARARRDLVNDGFDARHRQFQLAVDVRYVGQSYEITVPWTDRFADAFDCSHRQTYGYADPSRQKEIVNLRVRAIGLTRKPRLPRSAVGTRALPRPIALRDVWFSGRRLRTAFYRWEDLGSGMRGFGPTVFAGSEATLVIPPTWRFRIDPLGTVVASRSSRFPRGRIRTRSVESHSPIRPRKQSRA